MAEASTYREIGDYIIDTSLKECLGSTLKVTVHPGKHKLTDTQVAAKKFVWDKDLPTDIVDEEVEIMRSIPPHDNVLKLVDYVKIEVGDFKELWLILELCPLGHLGKFAKNKELTLPQKADLMLQSAQGVHHLHHLEKPLIHRDLKPANLLLTGDPHHPQVKVADYGESRYFQGSQEHSLRNMTAAGTPYYQAPELFGDSKSNKPAHNKAVDTYALGVSFLNLLDTEKGVTSTPIKVGKKVLGEYLHENPDTDVRELVMKPGDSDEVKQVKNLICEMLVKDPTSRVLIKDVVERLRLLRTSLGVKVLLAVDTVWEKPVFHLDTDLMDRINTIISQESPVTTDPEKFPIPTDPLITNAAMRMEHAEKVISEAKEVLDQLTQLHVESDMEDRLLAVDMEHGVWIHEGAEWEMLSGVPDECPSHSVCMCRVSDGLIACGGCAIFSCPPVSQCHHFSLLTRQWRKLANMITPRHMASAVEYDDMKVLVVGGLGSDYGESAVCEILDCENDKWFSAASMPKPLVEPLVAAQAGRVFILPREFKLIQPPRLLVYDPRGIKHIYKSKLPTNVRNTEGACLVSASHKLYLLGGNQGLALEYNLDTDQWNQLTPPSFEYWAGCCAAVTPGMIKLYGGSTEGQRERNMAEVYDTHTQKWDTLGMRLPFSYNLLTSFFAHCNMRLLHYQRHHSWPKR